MSCRWLLETAPSRLSDFAAGVSLHPAVASVLFSRRFSDPAAVQRFLNPSLEDLHDPFLYHDMAAAVQRMRRAIELKEVILVYGDYDVDGIASSSILCSVLDSLGARVRAVIPHRMREGYGLNLERLKKDLDGVKLVITADNGITANESVAELRSQGIDVIIVDHHQPRETLPDAFLIAPPKADPQIAGEDLAASGLAFMVAWALLGSKEKAEPWIDLACLGTIADMAPLRGDNRVIAHAGLKYMARTQHVGLRLLLQNLKINGPVTAYHVAFQIAPRINALGRMNEASDAFRFLTTQDSLEAMNLARVMELENTRRQEAEKHAVQEAVGQVDAQSDDEKSRVIVAAGRGWHEGVAGIVAARLVEHYHRPAVVLALREGEAKGSARSITRVNVFEALKTCEELFLRFGGHPAACGMGLKEENVATLRRELNLRNKERIREEELQPVIRCDAEIKLDQLNQDFFRDLSRLEPFGAGNARPVFVTRNLTIKSHLLPLKPRGYRFLVEEASTGKRAEVVSFKTSFTERLVPGQKADVAYQPRMNDWQGIKTLQLTLQDFKLLEV